MDIESDIAATHQGSPFSDNLPSFSDSEATTRGAPFHNALQALSLSNYPPAKGMFLLSSVIAKTDSDNARASSIWPDSNKSRLVPSAEMNGRPRPLYDRECQSFVLQFQE